MNNRKNNILTLVLVFMLGLSLQGIAQKNNVKPSIQGPDGFRIGSFSGNLSYSRADFIIESTGPDLDFVFQYKSHKRERNRGFGYGWVFNFDKFYKVNGNLITIEGTDGGTKTFNFKDGAWNAESGVFDVLDEYATGMYRTTSRDGVECYFDDASHRRVTRIVDRCGNTLSLSYTDSLVTQMTDHTGRSIDLEWTSGMLTKLSHDLLSATRTYEYTYNSNGDLVEAKDPIGYTETYLYDEEHRLIQVNDKKDIPTHIAYRSQGGVKQLTSCDMVMSLSYNPVLTETYVVQQVGDSRAITSYGFDEQGRLTEKQGNCCGEIETLTYDDNNNVIYRENGNGEGTTRSFDDRGNPITRTDPEGHTEQSEYESPYSHVTKYTDALGNTTIYNYDPKGNLEQVVHPIDVVESYTYNTNGDLTSFTNGRGFVTTYEYDALGYLEKIIYPDTTEVVFVHDAVGNTISETDENGHTTTYEYDALNRLTKEINALGFISENVYDAVGNVIEEINALGHSTFYEFDGLDQMISKTSPEGITNTYEYDASGNIIRRTDGMGYVYQFEYNNRSQLVREIDPLGFEYTIDYDAAGRKIMETDKLGNAMTYEYDGNGQMISSTDAAGNTYTYAYDAAGRKVSETNPRGFTKTVQYDALDRIVLETDELGHTLEKIYDKNDNLIETRDEREKITQYFYDKRDRKIRSEFPEGLVAEFAYDSTGRAVTSSPAPGVVLKFTYDAAGRLTHEENAGGEIRMRVLDSLGRVTEEHLPNGNIIQSTYDKDNRLIHQSDSLGHLASYQYNNNNEVISFIDSDSLTFSFTYDALNRLIEEKDQSNRTRVVEYNANSRPIKQINRADGVSTLEYNELGLAIKTTNANGDVNLFEYDEMANLTSLTDALGNRTTFEFDALNRPTRTTYPDGTSSTMIYDPAGNIIYRIDAENRTTNYIYDDYNRLVTKSYPDASSCTFAYDAMSRLQTANNANANIIFTYDINNRLKTETVNGEVISYTYDEANRTKTVTYPSGRVIEEELDFRRRMTNVKEGSNQIASSIYSGDQIQSLLFDNGLTTHYTYDDNRAPATYTVNPGAVFDFSYDYNVRDQKTGKENLAFPAFSEVYGYDNENRLLSHKRGTFVADDIPTPTDVFGFSYDGTGNRITSSKNGTSTAYTVSSTNAYSTTTTNAMTTPLSYTMNGHLIDDGVNTYAYDFDGRLTDVGSSIDYRYDAMGRRFQKTVGAVTTTYYYYEDQVIQEDLSTGETIEHIYMGELDFRVASINTAGTYYCHLDLLKTVIGLSDAGGNVFERYEYDSYGNVLMYDGAYDTIMNSSVGHHFFFTGKELDLESGLYYMRARHYHPGLGRFMQRDPIGYYDGPNIYEYVASNPINNYDPDGMKKCVSIGDKSDLTNDKNNPSKNKQLITDRDNKGKINGAALITSSIKIAASAKSCEECCDETKKMGRTYEFKGSVTGSFQAAINGLDFFGPSRALNVAARLAGLELFAGVKLGLTAQGKAEKKKDACDKWSGEGCLTATLTTSGELSARSTLKFSKNRKGGSSVGGSLSGIYQASTCVKCNPGGCDVECELSITSQAKVWADISYTVWGITTRLSFEKSWSNSATWNRCLIPID